MLLRITLRKAWKTLKGPLLPPPPSGLRMARRTAPSPMFDILG